MRSQFGTRSGWLNLELVATSILCHPHTAMTRACNISCGWGFGLGGGTVNHSTSPSVFSLAVSVCLLSVSLSEIYVHSHLFAARHSLKFLEKPQSSSFTSPHPNNPSQTNLYTNTRTHTHAHYKNLVYLRELKEGLPHLLFSSFFTRNRVCMLMCVCMQRNAVYVL